MRANKAFGQNFLISPATISRIISVIEPHEHPTILEIGPGRGALTRHLSGITKNLVAVEIDPFLASRLSDQYENDPDVSILNRDILDPRPIPEIKPPYAVAGSLPYNISKPIIRKYLTTDTDRPTHVHVVTQKEVAEDYTALPPKNTFLASFARIYSEPEWHFPIPNTHFSPIPKVDGAFISFSLKAPPPCHEQMGPFFRGMFSNPRKTIKNNIASFLKGRQTGTGGIDLPPLPASIKPDMRPSELSFSQLTDLFFVYNTSYQHEKR
jgi:16S rRNA (adenine1518-N6/adenine1519-N6)-dimethyltransferase